MNVTELHKFLNELPDSADGVEIKALRNYPDDASIKGIQQAIYRPCDETIYLYLK
ncbi:MAG: hypothetical protein LUE11_04925 [Clostridia bacterium]|nr:hypothetical protein [Clostridia bacterium]